MAKDSYDIISVGGGLAGASLANVMARRGYKVLVLERERVFKDRVRGEQMHPWGVAELRELGLHELLSETCGHDLPWFDIYLGADKIVHRNLVETTPQKAPEFSFYHPAMQEILLQAAADAGAEIKQGVVVSDVKSGAIPSVTATENGRTTNYTARLVVGADGRNSKVRQRAGFTLERDPDSQRVVAGVLLDDVPIAEDTSMMIFNPDMGSCIPFFPQGDGRVRSYLVYQKGQMPTISGAGSFSDYVAHALRIGCPAGNLKGVRVAGPLATFNTENTWVEHPYKDGVVLVGDAAGSNDPCFGEGLSVTLRDVRVLRDKLLAGEDWDAAGNAYALERNAYFQELCTVTTWVGQVFYDPSPKGKALRAKALPRIAEDVTRMPDHFFTGPDGTVDDTVRDRLFGDV